MKGDFLGFSFNGIHSSQLGITRVSDGDRYKEELFPEFKDRTSEIINNDGELYFGSDFKQKTHSISIAFDSLTELQFRKLRRLFGTKKICELIFDERPYKVYYVKLAKPIELQYICFDDQLKRPFSEVYPGAELPDGVLVDRQIDWARTKVDPWVTLVDDNNNPLKQRIYKGEGEIEFVSYYPFAKQLYKVLDYYAEDNNLFTTYENIDEWALSSGILDLAAFINYNIDKTLIIDSNTNGYNLEIPVYNPGDLNTGFYLYIPFNSEGKIVPDSGDYIKIAGDNNVLLLNPIERKGSENGIIINTVNRLIEGVTYDPITERENHRTKTWVVTGNLYNDSIEIGDFPQILRSDWYFDTEQFKQSIYLNCQIAQGNESHIQINYDYLYF